MSIPRLSFRPSSFWVYYNDVFRCMLVLICSNTDRRPVGGKLVGHTPSSPYTASRWAACAPRCAARAVDPVPRRRTGGPHPRRPGTTLRGGDLSSRRTPLTREERVMCWRGCTEVRTSTCARRRRSLATSSCAPRMPSRWSATGPNSTTLRPPHGRPAASTVP